MQHRNKFRRALGSLVVLGVVSAPMAKADHAFPASPVNNQPSGLLINNVSLVFNGDFGDPINFNGWSVAGNNAIESNGTYTDSDTPLINQFAAISSNTLTPLSAGTSPVASTNLANGDTFFGLASGTLAAKHAGDYSGISQVGITVGAGQSITFSWEFATNEANPTGFNRDFAFYTLQKSSAPNATYTELASANPATTPRGPTNSLDEMLTEFTQNSGFHTFTTGPLAAGVYSLGFGVSDFALPPATPLPMAAWGGLALFGGIGLMQVARRRKAVLA